MEEQPAVDTNPIGTADHVSFVRDLMLGRGAVSSRILSRTAGHLADCRKVEEGILLNVEQTYRHRQESTHDGTESPKEGNDPPTDDGTAHDCLGCFFGHFV